MKNATEEQQKTRSKGGESADQDEEHLPEKDGEEADEGIIEAEEPGITLKEDLVKSSEERVKVEENSNDDQGNEQQGQTRTRPEGFPEKLQVAGKHAFVARVDPRTTFKMGEKVKVAFNMGNFHIFDQSKNPDNPVAVR